MVLQSAPCIRKPKAGGLKAEARCSCPSAALGLEAEGRCSCTPPPIRLKRPGGRASLQAQPGGPVLLHPIAYKAENAPEGMPLYRPSLEGSPV